MGVWPWRYNCEGQRFCWLKWKVFSPLGRFLWQWESIIGNDAPYLWSLYSLQHMLWPTQVRLQLQSLFQSGQSFDLGISPWEVTYFRYASIYTKVSSHGREETWKWEDSLSCFLPKHNWSLRSTCILGCLILFSHLNAARSGHSKFRIHRHLPNAWDKCRRLSACWKTNSSSHLLLYSWLPFLFVFIFFKLQNFLFSHKKNRIILEKWK